MTTLNVAQELIELADKKLKERKKKETIIVDPELSTNNSSVNGGSNPSDISGSTKLSAN